MTHPAPPDTERGTVTYRRDHAERGAAMVEFVLILPVFLLLVFGGITAALSYQHKSETVHAVRDGARYGATVPLSQCDDIAKCGNRNWAQLVQHVTAERSGGTLSANQICVALVTSSQVGDPATVYSRAGGVYTTGANATFPDAGCFSDGNQELGTRVHVSVVRDGDQINLIVSSIPITVSASGTARYEQ